MARKLLLAIPVLLLVVAVGFWFFVNQRTRAAVDAHIERMVASGEYEEITYDALHVGIDGTVRMEDLRLVNPMGEVVIEDIELRNPDFVNPVPQHIDIHARGLRFPAGLPTPLDAQDALFSRFLNSHLQGDVLPLQVDYSYRYAPADAHKLDSAMQLSLPGAFVLQADSVTGNLDLAALDSAVPGGPDPLQSQLQTMQVIGDMEITSASLRLEDKGMVDALLMLSAQDSGVAPEEMRRLLVTQARNLYLFAPQTLQELAIDAGTQLASFLEGGRTLAVGIAPPEDTRFGTLQQDVMGAAFSGNFNRIAELLGLEISAY